MDIAGGRFVITGGASLIGSHVADRLLAEHAGEVVLLDNFSLGTPETVSHLDDNGATLMIGTQRHGALANLVAQARGL